MTGGLMGTITEAAAGGDELETLQAMRDSLAAAMDDAPATVVAQISGRLEAVLKRISELGPAKRETLDDALAQRRANRANPGKSAGGRNAKSAG